MQILFGLPDENQDTMQSTLVMMDANTEMVNFYSAMAYPWEPIYY